MHPTLQSAELPQQVDSLLKAVEATNIFEAEMARRFEGAIEAEPSGASEDAEEGSDSGGGGGRQDDSRTATAVRQRYEKLARERHGVPEHVSPARRKEQVGWTRLGSCCSIDQPAFMACHTAASDGLGSSLCVEGLPEEDRPVCHQQDQHSLRTGRLPCPLLFHTGARHIGSRCQDHLQREHILCVPALPVVSSPARLACTARGRADGSRPAGLALACCLPLADTRLRTRMPAHTRLPTWLPACSVYLDQAERDLMAGLERLMREEAWQPLSADLPVLRSRCGAAGSYPRRTRRGPGLHCAS